MCQKLLHLRRISAFQGHLVLQVCQVLLHLRRLFAPPSASRLCACISSPRRLPLLAASRLHRRPAAPLPPFVAPGVVVEVDPGAVAAEDAVWHQVDEVSPEIVDALAGRGADVPEVAVPGFVQAGRQKDDFVCPDQPVAALGEDGDPVQADPDVAAVPQLLPVAIAVDFGILPYVAAFLVEPVPVAFVFLHCPAGMPGRVPVALVDALVMAGTMA